MKILLFLQNAYMNKPTYGRTIPYDVWYYLFKNCHSGRRTSKIFGNVNNMNILCKEGRLKFCNTTSTWGLGSNSRLAVDIEYVKNQLNTVNPDLVIACGKQAEECLLETWNKSLIIMPHPASRTLTNKLLDDVRDFIKGNDFAKIKRVAFRQRVSKIELEKV